MPDTHTARHQQLTTRRDELIRRLGAIEDELESHASPDWEEQATEREEDEMLEGMGNAGLQELRRIEAALARIADGSYGVCVRCGAEIAPERLDLLPETPFCAACAR